MSVIAKLKKHQKLMRLLEIAKKRFSDAELGNSSIVVSYYLLLSLFPLLLAVGNLLPFLHIDPDTVLPYIQEIIPAEIFSFIGPAITNLLTESSGGVLSISALAALWSASQSINALQGALNKSYGVAGRPNFIVSRLVSVLIIILLLMGIIGITLILGVGKSILDALQPVVGIPDEVIGLFQTVKWPATIVALLIIMTIIYWLVPNAKVTFPSAFPGAVVATIGWMILGQVFGLYTRFFAAKVSGYQIIGSFIVLMLWLNFAATIVLVGGIVNAIIAAYRSGGSVAKRTGPMSRLSARLFQRFVKHDSAQKDTDTPSKDGSTKQKTQEPDQDNS
ncbi:MULTISPECIES: YihY/virulence factor BrkB family protein [Enterococcus]|uniref:Membrane protein n=1 Tax=Enterococcus diestrammenae TaxID=1155073 RepID=A0ABV0F0U2_9ENTE|nr:YihY/virulence factor BrkB family protein [Enterococcus diestrammenae]KAF1300254.1 ribonuclease BN [Enterococcus diestrammenae]HIX69459.1 YihY/virulence factor BrkB family protein [Candidatus Enterococcus stercoravium]